MIGFRYLPRLLACVAVLAVLAVLGGCGVPTALQGSERAEPWPERPVVDATLDLAGDLASATGTVAVRFTPDREICEVVFRNWANRPTAVRDGTSSVVTAAAVDGRPVTPQAERGGAPDGAPGTLVTLPLPGCVPAGTPVSADVGFRLTLGEDSGERIGYSPDARTAWLATALPLLAYVRGEGWVRDPAVRMFGETVVGEDFRLDALRVTTDTGRAVAGTGSPAGTSSPAPGRTTHLFVADAVRDIAVSAGDYAITERRVGDVTIRAAIPRTGVRTSAGDWIGEHERSLASLQDLLGTYPYPDMWVTVVPSLSDGIEFPTHMFYGDVGERTRPSLVAHELAHQWFYSLVGNDQGRHPWLDESFATYAQAVVSGQRDDYRLRGPDDVRGPIGAPMSYWDDRGGFTPYVTGVYDQGAAALLAGRERAGAERFDAALRDYVDTNAHRVVVPADVEAAFADLPEVLDVLREHGAFRTS